MYLVNLFANILIDLVEYMSVFLLADLYYQVINGNPLNLEIEKLSNVPGKYFKRKRWRCRNGLGFVKFIYEGQVAVTRICGRDFFINGQPGSLPYLVSNEEIGQFHYMFSRFLNLRFFFPKVVFVLFFYKIEVMEIKNADITVYHKRKTLCSPL